MEKQIFVKPDNKPLNSKNPIFQGKIKFVGKQFIIVKSREGYDGFLHFSEISDFNLNDSINFFKKGREYQFYIIQHDDNLKKIKLSWKKIVPNFSKNPFKFELKRTQNNDKNLLKWVNECVDKHKTKIIKKKY